VIVLASLASLVSLVCWIFVLIKMFPAKGPLHGILGIICVLYAFIWGWQNSGKYENMRNVMIAWTIAIVISAATSSSFTATG
jgi:hypothetical protein